MAELAEAALPYPEVQHLDDEDDEDGNDEQPAADTESLQVPPNSLLQLLLQQRTGGESGVRLTFHKDLAQNISLSSSPYHFCGMTGNTALAAFLHFRGVAYDSAFTVASFSANGTSDSSPWMKVIGVSASETALLAGHSATAAVLTLVEAGVPLFWSRQNHSSYPAPFRKQTRPLLEALVTSPGFVALPGPARVGVVDHLMQQSAREVWSAVDSSSSIWDGNPQPPEGQAELWAAAVKLPLQRSGSPKGDADSEEQQLPQYQFRMGLVTPGRARRMVRLLSRATAGAAAVHVARHFGCCSLLPNAGLFFAGFLAPMPAFLVLSSIKLHEHMKQQQ